MTPADNRSGDDYIRFEPVIKGFVDAWRAGEHPRIEDVLLEHPALDRTHLLRELILEEKEFPTDGDVARHLDHYLVRFPDDEPLIREIFDESRETSGTTSDATPKGCPTSTAEAVGSAPHAHSPFRILTEPARYAFSPMDVIGQGGMGIIYRVHDRQFDRDLAIKVLAEDKEDKRGKPAKERRFVREAQITGRLQHPGIVPVHEMGRLADGRLYFAMKLVGQKDLGAELRERTDPAQDRQRFLKVFEQITQTMAYAHAHEGGVIHRDLKPSNIMVGDHGEVLVMDWGLAKFLAGDGDDEATQRALTPLSVDVSNPKTEAGFVFGTFPYMAPEQARGEIARVDARSDVFGLGAILCKILTGQPPYEGTEWRELLQQAQTADLAPALARLDACGADPELLTLARRCLASEPGLRPRDAGEVAAAMTAYLEGAEKRRRQDQLDRAKAETRAEEEGKRRRLAVGLAVAVVGLVVSVAGGWAWQEGQRQTRAAAVDVALGEAEFLKRQAEDSIDDLSRWNTAHEAARQVKQMIPDARDEATRQRITALNKAVSEGYALVKSNRKLIETLMDIYAEKVEHADGAHTDTAYAAAFRSANIDVDALEPAEVAARIRRRPKAVAQALVAALDDWAVVRQGRDPQRPNWTRLIAAARAADPDPQRNDLRAALFEKDAAQRLGRLRPLAKQAEAESWAPASLAILGVLLVDAGDINGGVAVLRRASVAHPGDVWVNFALGAALEQMRPPQIEDASRAYTAAWAVRPQTGHELAHALKRSGRVQEADDIFRDLIRRWPSNTRHLTCYGEFLKGRGLSTEATAMLDRAIAAAREAIRLDPGHAHAHVALGGALMGRGKFAEAEATCREAIRLDPGHAPAHDVLSNALAGQGKFPQAEAAAREAIRLKADYASAHVNLGNALMGQGKFATAEAAAREAIRLDPGHAHAHAILANALVGQRKFTEAEQAAREAIRLNPGRAPAHAILANALVGQRKFTEAEQAAREAIRLEADYAPAHAALASALVGQGKFAAAEEACREAIRLDPGRAPTHVTLANALVGQRKFTEAEAAAREAIRLDPREALAHVILANALVGQRKFATAEAACREAIRLNPREASAHVTLGNVLAGQGKFAEAEQAAREADRLKSGFR
jgi:serine/threonine-protein kinase